MTDATPLASEQITQEDREAGALAWAYQSPLSETAFNIRAGNDDGNWIVQAFARHRIAALSASPAPSDQDASQAQGGIPRLALLAKRYRFITEDEVGGFPVGHLAAVLRDFADAIDKNGTAVVNLNYYIIDLQNAVEDLMDALCNPYHPAHQKGRLVLAKGGK